MNDPGTCFLCLNEGVGEFCKKNNFTLWKCLSCGFVFVPIKPAELAEYYTNNYMYNLDGHGYVDYEIDKMPMRPVYSSIIGEIKAVNSGDRLLDVGAANGYFVEIARDNHYQAEGIDINADAVGEAERLGRQVKLGDLLRTDYGDTSFDVITMFDVIEHVPSGELSEHINRAWEILSPGGVLAIITLNTSSLWARLLGKGWHAILPPEHVSYFSENNIQIFLKNNGFQILTARTLHKNFSLQYIFHSLYRWQRFSLWRRCTRFLGRHSNLGRISVKLRIGDNILILAKKNE